MRSRACLTCMLSWVGIVGMRLMLILCSCCPFILTRYKMTVITPIGVTKPKCPIRLLNHHTLKDLLRYILPARVSVTFTFRRHLSKSSDRQFPIQPLLCAQAFDSSILAVGTEVKFHVTGTLFLEHFSACYTIKSFFVQTS